MKISTKSWHYQLNQFFDFELPTTLCGYFWQTIFNILMLILFIGLIGLIIFFFLSPILQFLTTNSNVHSCSISSLVIDGLMIFLTISGLFFKKISFGKVIIEYIKALKNKVCPLIEYEGKSK